MTCLCVHNKLCFSFEIWTVNKAVMLSREQHGPARHAADTFASVVQLCSWRRGLPAAVSRHRLLRRSRRTAHQLLGSRDAAASLLARVLSSLHRHPRPRTTPWPCSGWSRTRSCRASRRQASTGVRSRLQHPTAQVALLAAAARAGRGLLAAALAAAALRSRPAIRWRSPGPGCACPARLAMRMTRLGSRCHSAPAAAATPGAAPPAPLGRLQQAAAMQGAGARRVPAPALSERAARRPSRRQRWRAGTRARRGVSCWAAGGCRRQAQRRRRAQQAAGTASPCMRSQARRQSPLAALVRSPGLQTSLERLQTTLMSPWKPLRVRLCCLRLALHLPR